ncbi:hypothetical protein BJV77DRAFT_1097464 [Russula vinacea]|nr:hypothetical protein BJV77DRAFT_1097464 [Russula vinacea]
MSRLPPALLYLTIYNPTLKPSGPIADDDEDAEEQAHILFYASRERAVSRDKMLRQLGLAKALVNFSEMFVPEDTCDNVHSQSRRMLMVSPEPGFWVHACIELAKTPRAPAPNKGKGKAGAKAAADSRGKDGEGVVYDYHEGSVHDIALRAQVLQGYEEFKLTHGSFTSVLGLLGRQALELQLERFFTVWAWKWDIEADSELGNCLGVPLHPLYKSIGPLLDDFILDHPFLKNCAPFVLALSHLIPSADYTTRPPPFLYPSTSAPACEYLFKQHDRNARSHGGDGHAFVAIGASMDVRKWSWPGYLTFKGNPPKSLSRDEPVDDKRSSEEKPDGAVADSVGGEPVDLVPLSHETGLRGEVDRESLHEAISTDGRELGGYSLTVVDSTSQAEEPTAIALQTESDHSQDEQDPSPPASPSTPVAHPPELASPPSLSSSQSTLPVPVPVPSFRSFSLHFSPQEDPLSTAPRRVLYITKEQLTLAFLEPTPTISEDDNTALYQTSSALLANVQGLIDQDEANNAEMPVTAAKILQPKDKYLIAKHNETTVTSADFASYSEHLFNGNQMIANGDATEVFSRTQGPQHWHIARREPEGTVYLEVLRKETSLSDVENELVGIVRRFRESR